MPERAVQILCCFLVVSLVVTGTVVPVQAKSLFTARRTFGILFLGGSAVLAKKSVDFRQDADRIFDAYRVARTAEEASRLFDRTSDRDTKSQMSLGLSLVLLAGGLRLLLSSGEDDNIPRIDRRQTLKLDLESNVKTKRLNIRLKKRF